MSQRHELQVHRHSLGEIREIMNAMKTLAYMETRKLTTFLDAQHAVVNNMESAASDFLSFYGDELPDSDRVNSVYLLVGTERGFCGDINQHLVAECETLLQKSDSLALPKLVLIGHKLHTLLEGDKRVAASIPGASVVEDVNTVIEAVAQALLELQAQLGMLNVYALYPADTSVIACKTILPPFLTLPKNGGSFSHPPLLNISPGQFFSQLTEHYVLASLQEILYTSLMSENHRRVTHLDGAVQYLDEESQQLLLRSNALRQEEITEEIEVILLSADSLVPVADKKNV